VDARDADTEDKALEGHEEDGEVMAEIEEREACRGGGRGEDKHGTERGHDRFYDESIGG
jgi:hypothetical protein